MRLCAQCAACVDGTAKRLAGSRLQHHESLDSWLAALEFGCVLCVEMRQHLQNQTEDADTAKLDAAGLERTVASVYGGEFQLLSFSHHDENISKLRNVITGFTFIPRKDIDMLHETGVLNTIFEDETDHRSTGSPASMELAKTWLRACKAHAACCMGRSSVHGWLPLRLIDVQPSNPSIDFRIINTMATKVSGCYASLSHCWGKDPDFLTLNEKTELDLRRGLRLETLPQTFRDAIHVCRSLGTPFLWIDSLCILQDSQEDWEDQSRLMRHIYREAEYNISADASRNSHEGLFRKYQGHFGAHHTVSSNERSNGYGIPNGDYDVVNTYAWTQDISLSPLNLRAWVFQERHLARRILHFSRYE